MFWDLRISYFFERKVIFGETGNQFLGTERVSKLMRQYAIPCIISLLVGALYNIVDQIFIANASYLGSYGNAANTVVFPLTVIALGIAVCFGDGCCAMVSGLLGEGKKEEAKHSVGNAVLLTIISGCLLTLLYLVFDDALIAVFGGQVNAETFELSKEYFFYITLGIPFYMFGQAMNPIIRSDGSPRYAMLSLLAGAASQIGDLAASTVKRWCGVKDYSRLIGEHGGIMDKMDSMLFSLPVCWVCLYAFGWL